MNSGPKRLDIKLAAGERYVSRAALKLAGAAAKFRLDFKGKIVLDVGSSTGGFTDYSLKHGAQKVIAVEAGTGQLHPSLRGESRVELYEKTDIRDFKTTVRPDIVLIDVSFISLRQVLPAVAKLSGQHTQIMAMVKPQFEAGAKDLNKGVIKNDSIRRRIFKDFELWAKNYFIIRDKADSEVAGAKGNQERFYLLSPLK
jgi:23S rRNA (cytidine1920-2'-O)/16S rRNA (cytidine1409-2'-O)-methyltransferase